MPDQNQRAQQSIEELLAVFSQQIQENPDLSRIEISDDPELKPLQETVLLLNRIAPDLPSRSSAEKIKSNVLKIWEKEYSPRPPLGDQIRMALPSTAKSGYQSRSRRRQLAAIRIAAAAVLVIIAALFIFPDGVISPGSTSGAATGELNLWVFIGGLLIGGFGLWWWLTARRK